jgi:hypothetical protein
MLRLKLRGGDWKPDVCYYKELIAQAILFKRTQRIVRQLKIPAYGANVITYTISYLAYRCAGRLELRRIWEKQELLNGVEEAIRSWAPKIYEEIASGASGRNVTEWAKKEECWRKIRSLVLPVPSALTQELASFQPSTNAETARRDALRLPGEADSENIARVMLVPAEVWFKISDWGRQSGKLKAWQAGIAHTLSGYASDGWEKRPSVKQANQAAKILEIASEEFKDLAI